MAVFGGDASLLLMLKMSKTLPLRKMDKLQLVYVRCPIANWAVFSTSLLKRASIPEDPLSFPYHVKV
jgi:hypothetical protein